MTTALAPPPSTLPEDALALRPDGLLSHVARPCPEHESPSPCVARRAEAAGLVFWCPEGAHHFVARAPA